MYDTYIHVLPDSGMSDYIIELYNEIQVNMRNPET